MRTELLWRPFLFLAALYLLPQSAHAWEEQAVLDFILAHNPLLRAYHTVTTQYAASGNTMTRVMDHTSIYGRSGIGGTDFRDQPFILQAGIQINIPLVSTKEKRNHAAKVVEETRTMDEIRGKAMEYIAQLRRHEADLAAANQRLKFYRDKSGWLQKRVDQGFDEVERLWEIGQKLNEERAAIEKLKVLSASQRYQVAHHAGDRWRILLQYLEGATETLVAEKTEGDKHG